MKPHTAEFKNTIKQMGRELRGVITYDNIILEEEIMSITPHYEANILKSVMKQLDLELSVDIPLETVINCQIGILIDDDYEMLDFGNYVVYSSEKQEDANTYKIVCYDKLLYSMKQNEDLGILYPISIKNYLTALANKIGLTVASGTFYNQDLTIPSELYLDLDYTYRDILDEIAQATGSIIALNTNDEIEVRYPTITGDTIDEEFLKDENVDFGQVYGPINSIVLSRAGESDNVYTQDTESVQENGLCEVKIVDNQIMNFNNRSDFLQGLLAALDGLYYNINDFNSTGVMYYEVGDLYNVQVGENTYQCLMLNDEINVTTGIEEIIHADMPEQSQTDYSKADKTDRRINQTYIIVDKQNQTIESVVSNVTTQNNKISQITQTVDELNSKIQDIADITKAEESDRALVQLTEINQSEPIMIKIHPTSENISYVYPHNKIYPESSLHPKKRLLRFERTYQEDGETLTENIEYELPDDLLRYDSNVYDEFYLNYDSETCQVIKRCYISGASGTNLLNPEYLGWGYVDSSDGGISNILITSDEKIIMTPMSTAAFISYSHQYVTDNLYYLTFHELNGINANNIQVRITYYNSQNVAIGSEDFPGGYGAYFAPRDNSAYCKMTFNFSNLPSGTDFSFRAMLSKNTSSLPYDTYKYGVMKLEQEQVIDYPYPSILLGDGDYEVTIDGYDYGYLFVRLMAKNIYTTQFATHAEVSTSIEQTAQEIVTTATATYETKDNAITNYSELRQTATSLQTQVNNNNQSISTLQQTASSISATVQNNNTKANIIAKINDDTSMAQIEADSISLAGKTINMTGDNINISSTKFSVDKNGNMTCSNANITGGKINVSGSGSASDLIRVTNSSNSSEKSYIQPVGAGFIGTNGRVDIFAAGSNSDVSMIDLDDSYGVTSVRGSGVRSKYIYDSRTTSNTPNMQINSNGEFQRSTNTSSKRYKEKIQNITNEELDSKRLYNLPIIQFKYKDKFQPNKNDSRYNKELIGFIAEDVAKVYPIAADYNEDGEIENWNERYIIPAMLKLIQEQHIELEQMKKEIEKLKEGGK